MDATPLTQQVRRLGDELLKRERTAEDSIQMAKDTATAYEAASPGDKVGAVWAGVGADLQVIDSIQQQLIKDLEALARINMRKEALEELTTELRTSGGMVSAE